MNISIALAVAFGFAAVAPAQVIIRHGHRPTVISGPTNQTGLNAIQSDLISAIGSMKSALPIYDGNRVRAIHAAHNALVLVDHAIAGARAAKRPSPTVTDHVKFANAKSKYNQQQIAASQTSMEEGLNYLKLAYRDLEATVGSTPNKQGIKAGELIQKSEREAATALALHGNRA